MAGNDDLLGLIDEIYDAAIDESLWSAVMARITAATDSQAATFCVLSSNGTLDHPSFAALNFDPQEVTEYLDGMAPQDPTIQYIVAHPDQGIYHDSAIISERDKDRHFFYDWHHSFSDARHRLVGLVHPGAGIQSGITVHRSRAKGDYDVATLRRFAMLFGHLERALQIGFRLGTLGTLQRLSGEMLDRNPLAVMLLDDKGRVMLANRAARELAETADGVTLAADGLALTRPAEDAVLQRLIGEALQATRQPGSPPGGVLSAPRPSGKRPFVILVSPLSRDFGALTGRRAGACVVIVDPELRDQVPLERLRALYGLTPSEARIAAALASGEDLRKMADSFGITYATARSQLATIFRKTETSRQSELIRLLLTTLPFV